jgi:polysaccharide deacetylase family protein (PEP-CTERM system associated)
MLNAFTVDLEEYFHPTEVQQAAGVQDWATLPSRVSEQTQVLLELLDRNSVRATFFVLGWVAEHHPQVINRIVEAGHEIACHSYAHQLVYRFTPEEFRRDTMRAVRAIEDASGVTPRAYRAPSYSITEQSFWALEVLVECGFTHDSSIYPISHDRYGIRGFPRHAHAIETPSGPIVEVPVATVQLSRDRVAPIGGGGYLRLLPYRYTAAGIRRLNSEEGQPACIYLHPWEVDPLSPRLAKGLISRLRTYTGLRSMPRKVERLLSDFRFSTMSQVYAACESRVADPVGSGW